MLPAAMRPTVLLFDVDGTLVLTGGAGRRAMARAFGAVCGREDACAGFAFGGMTDRLIVRTGLCAVGHSDAEDVIDHLLGVYLDFLPDELSRATGYRIMPGVEAVLEVALARTAMAVGLGTGNIEPGARLKLAHGGLDDAFAFGGFGSDHEDRTELVRAGFIRGAARLGEPLERCRRVVVGDTPRDVDAARALEAEAITVATGGFTIEQLSAAGATVAFTDLTDPRATAVLLTGVP